MYIISVDNEKCLFNKGNELDIHTKVYKNRLLGFNINLNPINYYGQGVQKLLGTYDDYKRAQQVIASILIAQSRNILMYFMPAE